MRHICIVFVRVKNKKIRQLCEYLIKSHQFFIINIEFLLNIIFCHNYSNCSRSAQIDMSMNFRYIVHPTFRPDRNLVCEISRYPPINSCSVEAINLHYARPFNIPPLYFFQQSRNEQNFDRIQHHVNDSR